jgi:hypothetical protein
VSNPPAFAEFLARIRAGDARAAEELAKCLRAIDRVAPEPGLEDVAEGDADV